MEEEHDVDVDMEVEAKTPAASPQPTLEGDKLASPSGGVAEAEAPTTQDKELPPPTPADSPETALADVVEEMNQSRPMESAASTPSVDEPQRTEGT